MIGRSGGYNSETVGYGMEKQVEEAVGEYIIEMALGDGIYIISDQMKKEVPQIDVYKTGQNIKHIAWLKGMTVKDIQEYLGLAAVQSVYHWFAGRSLPTVDNLYALSEMFGVPMDALVCGNREKEFCFFCHPAYQRFIMYYKKYQELKTAG